MDSTAYSRLLMFYTGVEHAIDLTGSKLSRKVALGRPIANRLHSEGLALLSAPCWPTSNRLLCGTWEKGVKSIPFLTEKRTVFEEVSAQQDLLLLIYCLAGFSISLVEKEPDFISEKNRLLVATRPLWMLANEAGLVTTTPNDMLDEIDRRLNVVGEFARLKDASSRK